MTQLSCVQAYEPNSLEEQRDPVCFSFAALCCRFAAAQPVDSWTGVSAQELPSLWLLWLKFCPFGKHIQLVVEYLLKFCFILLYLKGVKGYSHEPVKCSKSWQQQYQNPVSHCSTFIGAIGCLAST